MLEKVASRASRRTWSETSRMVIRNAASASDTSSLNQYARLGISGICTVLFRRASVIHCCATDRKLAGRSCVLTRLNKHPIGLRSTPTLEYPAACASTNVVPQPQKGSNTTELGGGGSHRISAR